MKLTLNEAQNQLLKLLQSVSEWQEVIIKNSEGQNFQLILLPTVSNKPQFGGAKGLVKMLDNFDDPLDDFEDYMP